MPAPYIVNSYSTSYTTTGTSKTVTVDYAAGDSLIVYAMGGALTQFGLPTASGISFSTTTTYNNQATYGSIIYSQALRLTAGATGTVISLTETSGTKPWGFTCLVVRNCFDSNAAISASTGTGQPFSNAMADAPRGLYLHLISDAAAVDGSSRVWRTAYDSAPTVANGRELLYSQASGSFTAYAAYHVSSMPQYADFGLTSPTGMTYQQLVVELYGDDSVRSADSFNAGYVTAATTQATKTIISTSANRMLVATAVVGVRPTDGTDTGVTTTMSIGGRSLTSLLKIHSGGGTQGYLEVFYMFNPPSGNQTLTLNASQSADLRLLGRVFTNCNYANPFSNIYTETGSASSISKTLSNVNSRSIIYGTFISQQNISTNSTLNTGKLILTLPTNFNNSSDAGCSSLDCTGYPNTSTALRWTTAASGPYAFAMLEINTSSYLPPQTVIGFRA